MLYCGSLSRAARSEYFILIILFLFYFFVFNRTDCNGTDSSCGDSGNQLYFCKNNVALSYMNFAFLQNQSLPLAATSQSFAPTIVAAQVLLTNIMMLSVLIATFK
jgi:hypothetical protein